MKLSIFGIPDAAQPPHQPLAIRKNWLQAEFAQGGTHLHSLRDSDSLELRIPLSP